MSETDVATVTDPAVAPDAGTTLVAATDDAVTPVAAAAVATDTAPTPLEPDELVPADLVADKSPADSASGAAAGASSAGASSAGAASSVKKAALEDVEEAMKDVVDPELGINVVDLGLVYGLHVDDDNIATIDMTLTSAACPLTDVIEDQARSALTTGPGGGLVNDIRINWVWLPPWGPDKISDEGRDQLRALGFNV